MNDRRRVRPCMPFFPVPPSPRRSARERGNAPEHPRRLGTLAISRAASGPQPVRRRLAGPALLAMARAASSPRAVQRRPAGPARPRSHASGFSLLELLVVVAILGILVAAALPRFAEFRAAAYDSRSQQDLRNLAAAEELYRATSPTYADDASLLTGFAASEGVAVALESADETGFVATATHPAGSRDFRWDSSADPPLSSTAR